jgi:hypothetical protein
MNKILLNQGLLSAGLLILKNILVNTILRFLCLPEDSICGFENGLKKLKLVNNMKLSKQ